MLIGTHSRGIDPKNRLVIPPDMREAFIGGGYISDQGRYVGLFPAQEFRDFVARIQHDVEAKVVSRKLLQRVGASSHAFGLDTAGRVLLPANLRGLLPSGGDVLLAGAFSHVAVWDPTQYEAQDMPRDDFADQLEAYG